MLVARSGRFAPAVPPFMSAPFSAARATPATKAILVLAILVLGLSAAGAELLARTIVERASQVDLLP